MNRADQAPEPSIEELLASIRLIISDADKQGGPFAREPRSLSGPAGGYPGLGGAWRGFRRRSIRSDGRAGFPRGRRALLPGTPQAATRGQPGIDGHGGQPPHVGPHRGSLADAAQVHRPEARNGTQGPGSAPVWSRRELPPGAAQAPSAPRPRQEPPTARPMARNWAGDIQMPVSEHGPVPLFPTPPGNSHPEASAGEADGRGNRRKLRFRRRNRRATARLPWRCSRKASRVRPWACLRQETRRGHASRFRASGRRHKAEVAERFAAAIESVAQAVQDGQDEAFLTEVIDAQVFEPEPREQPAVKNAGAPAPAKEAAKKSRLRLPRSSAKPLRRLRLPRPSRKLARGLRAPGPEAPAKSVAPATKPEAPATAEVSAPRPEACAKAEAPANADAPTKAEARSEPEREVQAPAQPAPDPVATAVAKPEAPASIASAKPSAAPAPVAPQPLAQAQFMGAAQAPVSAQNGGPLESVVREMLRPLLVQWLNENMPRILENANSR